MHHRGLQLTDSAFPAELDDEPVAFLFKTTVIRCADRGRVEAHPLVEYVHVRRRENDVMVLVSVVPPVVVGKLATRVRNDLEAVSSGTSSGTSGTSSHADYRSTGKGTKLQKLLKKPKWLG